MSARPAPRARASTRVIYRHGLRNALLPLTTGLASACSRPSRARSRSSWCSTGPGIGTLLIGAITERDYAVIQGGVIVFALFVVLVNLLMDLVYIVVDPRIRVK